MSKIEWLRQKFEKRFVPHNVYEVADMLDLHTSHVRGILARLVKEGWIVRCDVHGKPVDPDSFLYSNANYRRVYVPPKK